MYFELLIIFLITAYYCNTYYRKKQNNLIIQKEDSSNDANLHEIHITINNENNFVKLISFVNKYEFTNKKKLKIVYAVSNVSNNQYMISHFINANSMDAIKKAKQIADEMVDFGIIVLRVKVEQRSTSSMPQNKTQYYDVQNYLRGNIGEPLSKCYFEFHLKLKMINNKSMFSIENMEKDAKINKNVAISYNLCSANMKPLLTIRLYDTGYIEAVNYKDKVISEMENLGYEFLEEYCQQEFSVYDNNSSIDDGWLIAEI